MFSGGCQTTFRLVVDSSVIVSVQYPRPDTTVGAAGAAGGLVDVGLSGDHVDRHGLRDGCAPRLSPSSTFTVTVV